MTKSMDELNEELLRDIADELFQKSQENLIRYDAWDTGFLAKSSDGAVQISKTEYEVRYKAPYALAIEYGRLAGSMPPVYPIQKWCVRKLGLTEKEAKNAAWAIAINIKNNGTDPRPFLRDAISHVKYKYKL